MKLRGRRVQAKAMKDAIGAAFSAMFLLAACSEDVSRRNPSVMSRNFDCSGRSYQDFRESLLIAAQAKGLSPREGAFDREASRVALDLHRPSFRISIMWDRSRALTSLFMKDGRSSTPTEIATFEEIVEVFDTCRVFGGHT